jgi:hypothetical protein
VVSKRDHERIWLEPCACDPKAERTWCHHSTVYDPCEECGAPPTEYVRADLVWGDAAIRAAYARGAREMKSRAVTVCRNRAGWSKSDWHYNREHSLRDEEANSCGDEIRALPDTPEVEAGEETGN